MNFCKKCNYVLNITKKQLDENEKNQYKIATLEAFLNYIKHDMNEANQTVDIKIDRDSLREKLLLKFKKTPEKVTELINLYDVISTKKNNFDVFLICNNCNSSYTIDSKTIILSTNLESTGIREVNLEYKCQDPTLPRTKDYICHNEKCISHKDLKVKEAIFFREGTGYLTRYMCTNCKTNWLI